MIKKHVFTLVTTFIAVALVGCANGERNIEFSQRETEESPIIIEETIESVVGEISEEGRYDETRHADAQTTLGYIFNSLPKDEMLDMIKNAF